MLNHGGGILVQRDSLKGDITASTALANSIQACIKGIDVAQPCDHTDPGIYKVGDTVWVKILHGCCSTQFKKGMVTVHILFSSRECHTILETSAHGRSASLKNDDRDESSKRVKCTAVFQCRARRFISRTRWNIVETTRIMPRMTKAKWTQLDKKWPNPIHLYAEAHNEGDFISVPSTWSGDQGGE